MMGSSPWLKDFFEAALQRPPRQTSLNGCYLQAVSSLAARRTILLYDGRHAVDAVLTPAAVTMLDKDEEQMGVTSRNLLGYVLAPVEAVVVPDMSQTPPTATLVIKHTRVFSDQQHNRPLGELAKVDADLSVLNALRANIGSKLASFATVSTLEKADRLAKTRTDQESADDHFNGIMQDIANMSSFPPAKLLDDPHSFNTDPPTTALPTPAQKSAEDPSRPAATDAATPPTVDANNNNDAQPNASNDVNMSDDDAVPIQIMSAESAPKSTASNPEDGVQVSKDPQVLPDTSDGDVQMKDVQSQPAPDAKQTAVEDDTQHPDWEVSFGQDDDQDTTMKDANETQDGDSDVMPQTQHFAVDDEEDESSDEDKAQPPKPVAEPSGQLAQSSHQTAENTPADDSSIAKADGSQQTPAQVENEQPKGPHETPDPNVNDDAPVTKEGTANIAKTNDDSNSKVSNDVGKASMDVSVGEDLTNLKNIDDATAEHTVEKAVEPEQQMETSEVKSNGEQNQVQKAVDDETEATTKDVTAPDNVQQTSESKEADVHTDGGTETESKGKPVESDTARSIAQGKETEEQPSDKHDLETNPAIVESDAVEVEKSHPANTADGGAAKKDRESDGKATESGVSSDKPEEEAESNPLQAKEVEPKNTDGQNSTPASNMKSPSAPEEKMQGDDTETAKVDDKTKDDTPQKPSGSPDPSEKKTEKASSPGEIEDVNKPDAAGTTSDTALDATSKVETGADAPMSTDVPKSTDEAAIEITSPAKNVESPETSTTKDDVDLVSKPSTQAQTQYPKEQVIQDSSSVQSPGSFASPFAAMTNSGRKRKAAQFLQNDRIREQQGRELGTPSRSVVAMKKLRRELDVLRRLRQSFDRDPDGFCLLPDNFLPD